MTRTICLGDLGRNRVFTFSGQKYKVASNMGSAGVAVVPQRTTRVRIGDREFDRRETREQIWSACTEVEIDVRRSQIEATS